MMKIDLRQNADDNSKNGLDADILADNSTINREILPINFENRRNIRVYQRALGTICYIAG